MIVHFQTAVNLLLLWQNQRGKGLNVPNHRMLKHLLSRYLLCFDQVESSLECFCTNWLHYLWVRIYEYVYVIWCLKHDCYSVICQKTWRSISCFTLQFSLKSGCMYSFILCLICLSWTFYLIQHTLLLCDSFSITEPECMLRSFPLYFEQLFNAS